MPERRVEPGSVEAIIEGLGRVTQLDRDLASLGVNFEAEREIPALDGESERGWVVVAVERLLNGRPALRTVVGPFSRARGGARLRGAGRRERDARIHCRPQRPVPLHV